MTNNKNAFPNLRVNMPSESPDYSPEIRNAYDCRSAGLIRWTDSSYKVVSSPNMSWIPDFPDVDGRGIYQRADGHWGPQEYSIWPQIHCRAMIHHMCIPRRVDEHPMNDILDKNRVVWRDVRSSDWVECGPSPFEVFTEPIGKLKTQFSNELSRDLELTIAMCSELDGELEDEQQTLLLHIANQARFAVEQLKREPRAERDVIQRVREVQRSIRELFGLFFYVKFVVRCPSTSNPVANLEPFAFRGTFIDNGVLAEEYRLARIPVWFIRPYESIDDDTRIYKIMSPTPWSKFLDQMPWKSRHNARAIVDAFPLATSRHVGLRSGRDSLLCDAGMSKLISVMRQSMGRGQGLDREPLETGRSLIRPRERSASPPPSLPHTKADDPHHAKRLKRKHKDEHNDKSARVQDLTQQLPFSLTFFVPAHLSDFPSIPSVWVNALQRISPIPNDREVAARYRFPPPYLFGHESQEKTFERIHNWIRIRPFCERAALGQTVYMNEPQGFKIQDWRVALLGDYTKGHLPLDGSAATPALERLRDTLPSRNDLVPKIDPAAIGKSFSKIARSAKQQSIKVVFAVEGQFTPYSRDCEAMWEDRPITYEVVRSDAQLRSRILWDVCERLFRIDLMEADRAFTGVDRLGDSMAVGLRAFTVQKLWRDVEDASVLFPRSTGKLRDMWGGAVNRGLLAGFLDILQLWPGFPDHFARFDCQSQSDSACRDVLQDCVNFYVEKYAEKFHRLPQFPVHVPF